jgi:hypothetical protein
LLEGASPRGGCWLRVRSREVSARLPRRDRASLRASTNCRLGLAMGWAADRCPLAPGLVREREGTARALDPLEVGAEVVAAGASGEGAAAGGSVRVALASAALRTRTGVDMYRLSAFFPAVVRALRRSRAASRLDVLAMSAR